MLLAQGKIPQHLQPHPQRQIHAQTHALTQLLTPLQLVMKVPLIHLQTPRLHPTLLLLRRELSLRCEFYQGTLGSHLLVLEEIVRVLLSHPQYSTFLRLGPAANLDPELRPLARLLPAPLQCQTRLHPDARPLVPAASDSAPTNTQAPFDSPVAYHVPRL